MNKLGQILKKRRQSMGMSVIELVEKSHVSTNCINALESNTCETHMDEISCIMKELDLGLFIVEIKK